jgi:fucose permease
VTLSFFALNGALFMLTLYLQQVRGLSPLGTGYRFIAIAAGVLLSSPIAARMTVRYDARLTTLLGLATIAVGMGLGATISVSSGDPRIIAILFVAAVGIGLSMTPATDAIIGAVPPDKFGVGSAVNDTTREIGGALGVAILGSLWQGDYAARVAGAAASLPAEAAQVVKASFAGAAAVAAQAGSQVGAPLLDAARTAFVGAMDWTCLVRAGFAVAGLAIAAAFLPARAALAGNTDVPEVLRLERGTHGAPNEERSGLG